MLIAIASGKGGTGKTTVATSLAVAAPGPVQLLDCDVEEPNCHLYLKPTIDRTEPVLTMIPAVADASCDGCGKCMEICRFKAITMVGGKVLTFPELCHGCGGCLEICPTGAITEGTRELGVQASGRAGKIAYCSGRLRVGEAMAPPLIRKVREQARGPLTIIDAPPGTSCPVIAAMRGVDFVLLVTEPTPFGLHDLRLAVAAVKVLDLPCGLVVNRSTIGDRGVYGYARREGLPVLMEIPFSREIAAECSQGRVLSALAPEWRQRFLALYDTICARIRG